MPPRPSPTKSTSTGAKGGKTVKKTTKPPTEKKAESAAKAPTAEPVVVTQITKKDVQSLIAKDPQKKIRNANKPVLLFDNKDNVARTLLNYCDTVAMIDGSIPKFVELETCRKQLLGCLRYDKRCVIDMGESSEEAFDELTKRFDKISEGLMGSLLDKSIEEAEKAKKIETPEDIDSIHPGVQYTQHEDKEKQFYLVVISQKKDLPEAFKAKFQVYLLED